MHGLTQRSRFVGAMLLALTASVAACGGVGGSDPPVATPSASAATAPSPSAARSASPAAHSAAPTAQPTPDKVALKAYFLLFVSSDESPGRSSRSTAMCPRPRGSRAAIEQLLDGPTDEERAHDLRLGTIGTKIPEGTRLLGIDIEDRIATVDLSGEFASGDIEGDDREAWAFRLAQVTFTLTQFATVESVRFRVEGEPTTAIEGHEGTPIDRATRDHYADQRPGICRTSRPGGGALTDPLTVSGMVQTDVQPPQFEAALVDRTTDEIIVQQTVKATCDMGLCWQPPGGGGSSSGCQSPEGAG